MYILALALTLTIAEPTPVLRFQTGSSVEILPSGSPIIFSWGPSTVKDEAAVLNYRMWCAAPAVPIAQRVIVKNFAQNELTRIAATPSSPAEIRATVTGLKDGAYACHITAWYDLNGTALESDPSPSLTFAFGSKPTPPTNFRRIVEQIRALLEQLVAEHEKF